MGFSIINTSVSDMEQSFKYSGLPKHLDTDFVFEELSEQDIKRAINLSRTKHGSGHDCFLKGINVSALVTAPQYWWLQFSRYHFSDIISSQSKTHMIEHMDIAGRSNRHVDSRIIEVAEEYLNEYRRNKTNENLQKAVSNTPAGLMLSAGIKANYLQLKTIHNQRKNHPLPEWSIVNQWIKGLPRSYLITQEEDIYGNSK